MYNKIVLWWHWRCSHKKHFLDFLLDFLAESSQGTFSVQVLEPARGQSGARVCHRFFSWEMKCPASGGDCATLSRSPGVRLAIGVQPYSSRRSDVSRAPFICRFHVCRISRSKSCFHKEEFGESYVYLTGFGKCYR